MSHFVHRVTAVAGAFLVAGSLVAAPAETATTVPSRVTVHSTDYTPASGETFRLYGAVWSEGHRVPARVRVSTFRDGAWVPLDGAVMHTNRFDRYRMRIILQMKGERLLRVTANPDATGIANSSRRITVTVH